MTRFDIAVRAGVTLAALHVLAACSSATEPTARMERVRACNGPATSLAPELAAQYSAPSTTIDYKWAMLARSVPGGFAGVFVDQGRPVLMLTNVSQASAARAALGPFVSGVDVTNAEVRQARWNFAQLYEWYGYVISQPLWGPSSGWTGSDIDEVQNRLVFYAKDAGSRDAVVAKLSALDLPCDLVLVGIQAPVVIATLPGH